MATLSLRDAQARFSLTRQQLDTLFAAEEVAREKVKGRWCVDDRALKRVLADKTPRLVAFSAEDFQNCLVFGIRSFYQYRERGGASDFGTLRRRDAGKFVYDFTLGKLGEIALGSFLAHRFDTVLAVDFKIKRQVVAQDITGVTRPRSHGSAVEHLPRRGVSVKTTKMRNAFLTVPQNEVEDPVRRSDDYVMVRVDLDEDYLLRLLRDVPYLDLVKGTIPEFQLPSAEVSGFISRRELMSHGQLTKELPNEQKLARENYVLPCGKLHHTPADWRNFCKRL